MNPVTRARVRRSALPDLRLPVFDPRMRSALSLALEKAREELEPVSRWQRLKRSLGAGAILSVIAGAAAAAYLAVWK